MPLAILVGIVELDQGRRTKDTGWCCTVISEIDSKIDLRYMKCVTRKCRIARAVVVLVEMSLVVPYEVDFTRVTPSRGTPGASAGATAIAAALPGQCWSSSMPRKHRTAHAIQICYNLSVNTKAA